MAMLNNQMVSLGWFFPCFGDEVAFGGTDFAEPLPTSESPDTPEPELLEGAWERVEIPIGIHGAAIYGVPWIPLIYPSHVSIYTSTWIRHGIWIEGEVLYLYVSVKTELLIDLRNLYVFVVLCLYLFVYRMFEMSCDSLWTVASPVNLEILKGYSGNAPWNKLFLKDVNLLIQLATGFCLSGKRKDEALDVLHEFMCIIWQFPNCLVRVSRF